MIEVRGTDGQVFRFPDGTPPEVMQRALQQHYGSAAPEERDAAPPRTMAPPPYFRPEQPAVVSTPAAPAAPQPPASQLGPDSLTLNAFGNSRFLADTAGDPNLNAALRVAADMERMGMPGGGSVYPGPGPTPPGGQPVPRAAPAPANPNLSNSALFQPQPLPAPQVAQAPPQFNPLPSVDPMAGLADPNAVLTRPQPGALPEAGFGTGGPVDPVGAPPMPGLDAPKAEQLAQVLVTFIPGLGWARASSLALNLLRTAAGGAIAGGVTETMQGGGPTEVRDATLLGGAVGAGIPAIGAPLARGVGLLAKGIGSGVNALLRRGQQALPDTAGLHSASQAAYRTADQSGAIIAPNVAQSAGNVIDAALQGARFNPTAHPISARGLGQVQTLLKDATDRGGLRFEDISTLRQFVTDSVADAAPGSSDHRIATALSREFNKFLDGLTPADIIGGGSIDDAMAAYRQGQATWARYLRSKEIDEMMRVAEATPAGYEQGLINEFRKLYRDADRWARYTAEEKDVIRSVIRGGPVSSVLRLFGKAAPTGIVSTGGGIGVGAATGAAFGVPVVGAVAVPALGAASKFGADFATRRAAGQVSRLVRGARPGGLPPMVQTFIDELASGAGRLLATDADSWIQPGARQTAIDTITGVLPRPVRTFNVAP